ncbi:MAG: Ig-like domain repeat protein, partial [Acidobacteriales bacterium]|nr:Ig-like domain repeat protein [Terriglobales bacterium]
GAGTLSGGLATITRSSLPVGSHTVTAMYSGDSNFSAATSAAMTQNIFDFTFGAGTGSSSSATISRGGTAAYTLTITPTAGQTTPVEITFSTAVLPVGAAAIFTPATLPKDSAARNINVSVSVPVSATAQVSPNHSRLDAPFLFAFLLLPLLANRKTRQALGAKAVVGVLLVTGMVSAIAMTGCGGGGGSGKTQAPQPQTYTLIVTASAGKLAHTANLTLTVQ